MDFGHWVHKTNTGTNPGTKNSGILKTLLDTELDNGITDASLASNQVTLPAGTYFFYGFATGWVVGLKRCLLYDTTGATYIGIGVNSYQDDGAEIRGRFTLSVASVLELRFSTSVTDAAVGWGNASSNGNDEHFSRFIVWKES
ncbi:MAG: hypothetical protein V3V96_15415 [Acidiferrobacterales bacterium]